MAQCPICGGDRFVAMTRTLARKIKAGIISERSAGHNHGICGGCGSRPRTRLIFAVLQGLNVLQAEKRVLHIAAEAILVGKLKDIYRGNYTIANISMEAMSSLDGVNKAVFDLCRAPSFNESFDVIIHSHVLEHVYCNWALALMRINSLLTEDGVHVFCVPVRGEGHYKEDLDPHLPGRTRVAIYGQQDHVRNFVKNSFVEEMRELGRLTGFSVMVAADVLAQESIRDVKGSGYVFVMRRAAGFSSPRQ
jgi:phosphoglycolate phosphatase